MFRTRYLRAGSRSLQFDHHREGLIIAMQLHSMSGLCGSSTWSSRSDRLLRMLVRCRTLSMAIADRTPLILICRLLECSRSLADILERLIKLSQKSSRLTTLVAHFLTSRTLGRNPRIHKKNLAPTLSFLFSSFLFFSHTEGLSNAPFSLLDQILHMPHLLIFLKTMQDASFQHFHRVRG